MNRIELARLYGAQLAAQEFEKQSAEMTQKADSKQTLADLVRQNPGLRALPGSK